MAQGHHFIAICYYFAHKNRKYYTNKTVFSSLCCKSQELKTANMTNNYSHILSTEVTFYIYNRPRLV